MVIEFRRETDQRRTSTRHKTCAMLETTLGDQTRGGARGFSGWSAAGSLATRGLRSTGSSRSGTVETTTGTATLTGGGDAVLTHIRQCADLNLSCGAPGAAGSVTAPVSTRQIVANDVGSTACCTTASAGKAMPNRKATRAIPEIIRRCMNKRMGRMLRAAGEPRQTPGISCG